MVSWVSWLWIRFKQNGAGLCDDAKAGSYLNCTLVMSYKKKYDELLSIVAAADYSNAKRKLTGLKIDSIAPRLQLTSISEFVKSWTVLVGALKAVAPDFEILNVDYQQFPNVKLTALKRQVKDEITATRSLELVFSLFGPYYTLFHRYDVRAAVEKGSVPIGNVVFLDYHLLQELKTGIDHSNVIRMISDILKDYEYISHYWLMMNKTSAETASNGQKESTLFELLFDPDQSSQVFE
jgi:hypothetical protein